MLLLIVTAWADQCAWNEKAHADAALAHLTRGSSWVSFCEPCGDAKPVVGEVGQATAANVHENYWEVSVDGAPIDLAYTFVRASPDDVWYTNLSKLVGCPSSSVSPKIFVDGPAVEQDSRLERWTGTFRGEATELRLSRFGKDPHRLQVHLTYPVERASTAPSLELSSTADVNADPVRFETPFAGCTIAMERVGTGGLLLTPTGCPTFRAPLTGLFQRR
jgi:hypothetical protein